MCAGSTHDEKPSDDQMHLVSFFVATSNNKDLLRINIVVHFCVDSSRSDGT